MQKRLYLNSHVLSEAEPFSPIGFFVFQLVIWMQRLIFIYIFIYCILQ